VLRTQPDIDYDGITGSVDLDAAGDRESAVYGLYVYGSNNKYKAAGSAAG